MKTKYNMNDKIKSWYVDLYPDDEMAADIPTGLTFNEFYERLGKEDAYEILKADDSIVRERVFLAVSEMVGIDYEELWDRHGKALFIKQANDEKIARDSNAENSTDESTVKVTDVYKCMYCGAKINWGDSNNPFDEGLHDIPDKYSNNPNVCCKYCNSITSINRNFKKLIEQPQEFNLWIQYIKDEISELESDKDKIIKHYLDAKRY